MSGEYENIIAQLKYRLEEATPRQRNIDLKMTLGYARGLLKKMEEKQNEINRLRSYLPKIEGYCFTNIDEYKRETWPTAFAWPPQSGEWVQSESGKILKVVKVTHTVEGKLRVELHKV